MVWFGRRKGDKDPPKPEVAPLPRAPNVIEFRQKSEIPPENRLAVHQLIDKILDGMSVDEYLMIEVCSSEDDAA